MLNINTINMDTKNFLKKTTLPPTPPPFKNIFGKIKNYLYFHKSYR